jgi:hypothetical protein
MEHSASSAFNTEPIVHFYISYEMSAWISVLESPPWTLFLQGILIGIVKPGMF